MILDNNNTRLADILRANGHEEQAHAILGNDVNSADVLEALQSCLDNGLDHGDTALVERAIRDHSPRGKSPGC